MNNNKGQALVEFVLILPVFLFLLFAIYDFGMMFSKKNNLESISSDVIELYKKGKTVQELNVLYDDIDIEIKDDTDYKKVTVIDNIKLITPGFNRIFGNPYEIRIERYIANEQ